MIKYYLNRVLRRLSKKVFLLGGTLICKKSVPFLFVATVSSLLYLLCLKLERMDWFQTLFSRVGVSLGGRALAIVFVIRAILSSEATSSLGMLPGGASGVSSSEGRVTQAPISVPDVTTPSSSSNAQEIINSGSSNDSLIAHASTETDSDDAFYDTSGEEVKPEVEVNPYAPKLESLKGITPSESELKEWK